jgi:hypothetical protein
VKLRIATQGKKHICPNCYTKYYDLGNPEAKCPKCQGIVKQQWSPPAQKMEDQIGRFRFDYALEVDGSPTDEQEKKYLDYVEKMGGPLSEAQQKAYMDMLVRINKRIK